MTPPEDPMKRFFTLCAGVFFLVLLSPPFVTGFGEAAMALPAAGACVATPARFLLRLRA
jgi:hypothetical protein